MTKCTVKHTKYQPVDAEWECPKCGEGINIWSIDWPAEDANDDCTLLHKEDGLRCLDCGYETTGQAFSSWLVKKNNLVPCPHCKGKGFVKK